MRKLLPVRHGAGKAVSGLTQRLGGGRLGLRPLACLGSGVLLQHGRVSPGLRLGGSFRLGLVRRRLNGIARLVQRGGGQIAHRVALGVHHLGAALIIDGLAQLVLLHRGILLLVRGVLHHVEHGHIAHVKTLLRMRPEDLGLVVHVVAGGQVDQLERDLPFPVQIAGALDRNVNLIFAVLTDDNGVLADKEIVRAVLQLCRDGQYDPLGGVSQNLRKHPVCVLEDQQHAQEYRYQAAKCFSHKRYLTMIRSLPAVAQASPRSSGSMGCSGTLGTLSKGLPAPVTASSSSRLSSSAGVSGVERSLSSGFMV